MDTTQSLECGDDHLFPRSDLKYQVHERGDGACGFILEVSFAGKYRPGAAGRPDAEFMTSILGAAIARKSLFGALLLDLTDLEYRWGNNILQPLEVVDHWCYQLPVRLVIIAGHSCIEALESILTPVGGVRPPNLHESRDIAFAQAVELSRKWYDDLDRLP